MKTHLLAFLLLITLVASPVAAYSNPLSCPNGLGTDLKCLIAGAIDVINLFVPFIFALALLFFITGIIRHVLAADPKKIAESRVYMFYGVIAIAVMFSVWSLALLVKNTFFDSGTPTPFGP